MSDATRKSPLSFFCLHILFDKPDGWGESSGGTVCHVMSCHNKQESTEDFSIKLVDAVAIYFQINY
jgi:hypothetical protein